MGSRYSIGEFAKRIGRSPQTVRCWETERKLQAKRLPSGHRSFDESDGRLMLGGAPKRRDVVIDCRVSSAGQQDNLVSQAKTIETDCLGAGIAVDDWISEPNKRGSRM